jgi:hypothetical protein
MTRKDAAAYLGLAEKTLAMRQLEGKPPRSVKVGGRRFYYKEELDALSCARVEGSEGQYDQVR